MCERMLNIVAAECHTPLQGGEQTENTVIEPVGSKLKNSSGTTAITGFSQRITPKYCQ